LSNELPGVFAPIREVFFSLNFGFQLCTLPDGSIAVVAACGFVCRHSACSLKKAPSRERPGAYRLFPGLLAALLATLLTALLPALTAGTIVLII
jgi:hypothetical protein